MGIAVPSLTCVAHAQDVKAHVDALAAELKAAAAPSTDLKKSLLDLRAAISALEAKASDDAAAFESRVDDIVPIAGRLANNPSLRVAEKATQLIAAAQPLEFAEPTKAAIARADALRLALPKAISTYPGLRAAVNALYPALDPVEEVNFLETVSRRSNSLSGLLIKAAPAGPPTSLDAIKDLAALDAAILAYRKFANPLVDVVYAEYGDMRDLTSPRRRGRPQLCDATDAMRKQCQGKPTCSLPAGGLCPVDPAALVPSEYKGAWILFRCMDPLLNIYVPPALAGMERSRGNSTWVPLRAATEEFRCTPAQPVVQVQK